MVTALFNQLRWGPTNGDGYTRPKNYPSWTVPGYSLAGRGEIAGGGLQSAQGAFVVIVVRVGDIRNGSARATPTGGWFDQARLISFARQTGKVAKGTVVGRFVGVGEVDPLENMART